MNLSYFVQQTVLRKEHLREREASQVDETLRIHVIHCGWVI